MEDFMESKFDRVMCGTCIYWNGHRELLRADKTKVITFDQYGICECPISSMSGKLRKRELKCKNYINCVEK